MSKKSLARVFQRWVARGNRVGAARPTARLRLEEVEHRVVPATTPAVTATASSLVANTNGAFAPQVVADPTNPNTLAMIAAQPTGILTQISFDAGTSWTVLRNTVPVAGDPSGGKLLDPTVAARNVLRARNTQGYTNVSDPTIAFSRSGAIYVAYLEHNPAKTSGALVVERFDVNRATQTAAQYDLDPTRDFDNDPATPANARYERANQTNNLAAVLYQWVDNGTAVNRPLNPYIAVDTNVPAFTDPATSQTTTDPFAAFTTTTQVNPGVDPATVRPSTATGGDTVFVAWNTQSTAPTQTFTDSGFVFNGGLPNGLVFNPNAIMLAVGRLDTQALIDRPFPDAPVGSTNQRQAAFLFSTPVPVNDSIGVGGTDAGLTFPAGGYFLFGGAAGTGGAAPVITFTPPSGNNPAIGNLPANAVTPGRMSIVWGTTGNQIAQSAVSFGAGVASASYTFRSNDLPTPSGGGGFFGGIGDASPPPSGAPANTPDFAATTTYDLPVDLTPFTPAQGGAFGTLDDLNVTVAITHNRLQDLLIQLISPDGFAIDLVENRINGLGETRTFFGVTAGLTGNDLGVAAGVPPTTTPSNQLFGNPVGTVFDQEAARQVFDPINPANYIGSYRPEFGSLASYYGRTAAQLNSVPGANWRLSITDVRADRIDPAAVAIPVRRLEFWSLSFTSRLDNSSTDGRLGADSFLTVGTAGGAPPAIPVGGAAPPARITTVPFGADQTFTPAPASPTFGIGPGVSVAHDTTLGSSSRYSGRMYVAYTAPGVTNSTGQADTNIFLASSDDGGATWNRPVQVNDDAPADNFSEGRRYQFQPQVTVDPTTGTVVVMWYDARNDASNTRVATYVSTSIDGGVTFSPSRPVNTQATAIDAVVTGRVVNLEPIPTNFAGLPTLNPGAGQYGGPGLRQSVIAHGGVIRTFWTGNLNAANSSAVFTATARTAAGPRVIDSDMGAVTEQSVDAAPGGQLQNGTILVRDENGLPTSITDAFAAPRVEYNNTFAPDGTRRIDGFRVVFDRPVYFGPGASQSTATADPSGEGFSAADVEVRFRGTASALDTATQGARVPLRGVVPIGGFTDDGFYFATAFFVQFATPQTAVGTYSYAVSPAVSDRVRSVVGASFGAADTPRAVPVDPLTLLPAQTAFTSTLVVPPLAGSPTVQNLQIGLSLTQPRLSEVRVTLTGPDPDGAGPLQPTSVVLFSGIGGSNADLRNARFSDGGAATTPTPAPFNNYNGVYAPASPLAAFNGQPLAGAWTLTVESLVRGNPGTLDSWRLELRDAAGAPASVVRLGNGLDQDADATQREAANDTYSAPGSTNGTPFAGPFDPTTRPLVAPGAHVVRTYPGGQPAVATTAVISNLSANFLDVTLAREVDAATLTLAGIAAVAGPGGPLTPTGVLPLNALNGTATQFRLTFANPLAPGAYRVTLNSRVFVTDDTVLNGTTNEVFVRFDRDINPASFTPANVLRITGPIGPVTTATVTVTPVADDRTALPPGTAAARLFRVTFDQPRVVATPTAPFQTIPITLSAAPLNGPLTIGDVIRVTGPTGPVGLTGATLTGAGTVYTLTLPAAFPAGTYTVDLNTDSARAIAVAGSGVRLSGPYSIEFGSNPAVTDPVQAAVRAADRPQAVVTVAAAQAFIDVTFSATNGAVTPADVLGVVGPNGAATPTGVTLVAGSTYRIAFAAAVPAGQYVIDFDPAPARNLRVAGSGLPVDSNANAGLDLLTGRGAAGGATAPQVFPTTAQPSGIGPAVTTTDPVTGQPVTTPGVAEMSIVITDDFTVTQDAINRIEVLLNISHPNDRDLTIELVPPLAAGLAPILLYRGADADPFPPGQSANFRNTRLVDRVNDPNFPSILQAQPDYFPRTGGFSPQTPLSRLADPTRPVSARGVWILRVTNTGTNTAPPGTSFPAGTPIQITNWQLTLPRGIPGTGLGERVADRFAAGFRVFTQNPTNELTRDVWAPVGPSPTNEGANAGRVTAAVVDPSDPSGNTVYVAGASGGVWKTTNFLTSDIDGPRYVPLTDFGPTTAINIQSLAVFPRNGDPNQTIVLALTGEGNTVGLGQTGLTAPGRTSTGVGVLRSTDGGRTWAVLDSTNNASSDPAAAPGTVGRVSDPRRDRVFSGASGFKIVVDPNPAPDGGVIVYMALSGGGPGAAGLWRSLNGGLTWTLVRAGQATDVVLGAGSANTNDPRTRETIANGNLQRLYAAFRGEGVYFSDSAPSASGLTLMGGQGGLPSVRDVGSPNQPPGGFTVGVQNAPSPGGNLGRIAIAAPALTNSPVRNSFYKDWLYAVVITPAGAISGLYQTKDVGRTWTQVQLPVFNTPANSVFGFPSNDETLPDYDVAGFGGFGEGNYDIAISVDPLNPSVIYLAGLGTEGRLTPVGGSIKIDLTAIKDTQAFVNNNNSDPAGGFEPATTGGLTPRVAAGATDIGTGRLIRGGTFTTYGTDFLNASRDPNNPFITNATLRVANVASLVNDGSDVRYQPFNDILGVGPLRPGGLTNERAGTTDIHTVFPFLDPVTGQTRFIVGGDQGVFTGVDAGDGTLNTALGFDRLIQGSRNGNLQLTQFYSGAVQPSQLAADVAGALFYGMAQDNGFTVAAPDVLATGSTNWRGPAGDGAWVEVDQTGGGTAFQYRSPTNDGNDNNTTALPSDFFRVFLPRTDHAFSGGIGRTFGLIQTGDNPATNTGQYPASGGFRFAVNPVNSNVLVLQSGAGRVFRSTDQGSTWIPIGEPALLDATGPGAQAFGAADPANPALTNNFIYVGTAGTGAAGGAIYVTTTGGGTVPGQSWVNISAGLDGTAIRQIIPNPAAGSKEVYVVTNRGVFYKADGTTTAPWTNITGNLFGLTRAAFGDAQDPVTALPAAGRAINSLAVDFRFTNPTNGAAGAPAVAPDLYVGGVGGVFKSTDFGATWRLFPAIATEGAVADGGYLPAVEVTDLDLSIGNLNPTTGQYQAGGLNLLLASTYGRGSYAIRLSEQLPAQSFVRGPSVTAVSNPSPAGGPSASLNVQFSGPVDPATIRPENFRLQRVGTGGTPDADVPILSVTAVPGAANQYAIAFQTQGGAAAQYRLTVGFDASGAGVPSITDPSGFRMNQNGNTTNGEPVADQFVTTLTLNGAANNLTVISSPATLTAGVSGPVRIEVRDATGTVVAGAGTPLTVTTTGPGAVQLLDANGVPLVDANGNPATTVPVVNGVALFRIRMTAAGTYTIAATGGANVNPTSFSTAVTAAEANSATLAPAATTVSSPGTATFTLTFQDAFGNPAPYTGTGAIAYTGAAVAAASPATVAVNTAAGQSTFTVATQAAGSVGVTVTLPRPSGGAALVSNAATVTVLPGTATTVIVTPVGAGPFVVGTPVTVNVEVRDANGNLAAVTGPLTVNPGSDPGAAVSPTNPQVTNGTGTFTVRYATPGSYPIVVSAPGGVTGSAAAVTVGATPPRPTPTQGLPAVFGATTGVDGTPTVQTFGAAGQPLLNPPLNPFPPGFNGEVDPNSVGFTGGIRTAVADVTGDGVADYVIGSGPTITATVQVVDGATNRTVLNLFPFETFKGGVFVSTGDLDGDGVADIVITPDQGGGPRVTVIKGGNFRQLANFLGIDDANFRGGARAALGDVNGDGFADLVVSAGFGGGPRVSIYDGAALRTGTRLNVIGDFFLFEQGLRNGAFVAVGDVNGDGLADIIGGAGPGGGPRVLVLDSATLLAQGSPIALITPLFNTILGDANNRGGIRVAAKNLDGDRFADIVVGAGEGGGSRVEAYRGSDLTLLQSFDLLPGYTGGVFVG